MNEWNSEKRKCRQGVLLVDDLFIVAERAMMVGLEWNTGGNKASE